MTRPDTSWMPDAACRTVARDVFFPDPSDHTGIETAVAICGICVVRDVCYDFAVRTGQEYGVWGGRSFYFRRGGARHRACHQCGHVFTVTDGRVIYCSAACKRAAHNEQAYESHQRRQTA